MRRSDLEYLHRVAAHHATPDRKRIREIQKRLLVEIEGGDADAAVALAWVLRFRGVGSPRKVTSLYEGAAALGHPTALLELANIHLQKGPDDAAIGLLRRAVRAKYAPAMVRLAQLHLQGYGVQKSNRRAERLLQRAWSQGNLDAPLWLGLKRDFHDGARWPEAARWYAIAARGGNVHAMVNYGVCLERGLGVRRRLDRAARWFEKAARLGDRDAEKALRRLQRGRPLAPIVH